MKTRRIAFLLSLLMVLGSLFNLNATLAIEEGVKDGKDVVFMLDRSMYTTRETLEDIRERIINLSNEIIEKDESASISVIDFNGGNDALVKNSRNIDEISEGLNLKVPFGFSNPKEAIKRAISLGSNENKELVLFTSIYPNIGEIDTYGAYGPRDHFYFRNANAYKNYVDSLDENIRIYTISDFNRLNNKDYSFATRLFKDTSYKYYEGYDETKREIAFNDLREDILSGVKKTESSSKNPIIFVPGIAGSELFVIDDRYVNDLERSTGLISKDKEKFAKRIWIPFGYDANKINDDLQIKSDVYGLQEGDLRFSNILNRHTGPVAVYSSLLDKLMTTFPDRPVYLFSYDWRKSNSLSAEKLNAFIDTINDGGRLKVDIVAHSMGGLVSSHLLKNHDEKVDKYLSFGTPYEGAPKAYNESSNNRILGGLLDFVIVKMFGIHVNVAQEFDGIVELYPTDSMLKKYPYQAVNDKEKFKKAEQKNGSFGYESLVNRLYVENIGRSLNPDDVKSKMAEYLGDDRFERFVENASIYRLGGKLSNNVMLMNRPNSMFFVGNGIPTAVSGYYVETKDGLGNVNEVVTNEGDMLVPLYSATMGMTFDEMTPEVRRKFKLVNGDHMGMLMDLKNLDMMTDFLNGREVR